MRAYEYIRLNLDIEDLSELNRLASMGWHITGMVKNGVFSYVALLERPAGDVVENLESLLTPDPAPTRKETDAH